MTEETSESENKDWTFITPALIKNAYLEQHCTKEEIRLIDLKPYFNWSMITDLDLSFLKLTHIENLSLITNVTRLKMIQNNIKRIENLEKLVKIENLDLGFNEITKIENLECLTELKNLNLQGNKISKLENLNGNSKLSSINVVYNEISDINEIFYLKHLKNLRSLEVANNLFGTNYRPIIIDQFPDLMFIDFEKITNVEQSTDKSLKNVQGSQHLRNVKYFSSKLHRDSFLDETDGEYFVKFLYQGDDDGQILSKWDLAVRTAFEKYQDEMTINAIDLCDACLKKYEILYYTKQKK
jgi:Leucine-rich repeat (LRR) protein